MPQRKIIVPSPILLTGTNGEAAGRIAFRGFLEMVFQNPIWAETYKAAVAQHAIAEAAARAEGEEKTEIVVAGEDWELLKRAVEQPRHATLTGAVMPGFGFMPAISRQILPMQRAIIEATEV
jgi:hypothetical protein